MATTSAKDGFIKFVLVHTTLREGNRIHKKPLLIFEKGELVNKAELELHSTVFLMDEQNHFVSTSTDSNQDKHIHTYSEGELRAHRTAAETGTLSSDTFNGRRVMGQICAGGAAGHFVHSSVDKSTHLIPNKDWFQGNNPTFVKVDSVTLAQALDLYNGITLVTHLTSGWCYTDAKHRPILHLPYSYPAEEEILERYTDRFAAEKKVYLERLFPETEDADPYHPQTVVRIPVIDNRLPGETLNLHTGLVTSYEKKMMDPNALGKAMGKGRTKQPKP